MGETDDFEHEARNDCQRGQVGGGGLVERSGWRVKLWAKFFFFECAHSFEKNMNSQFDQYKLSSWNIYIYFLCFSNVPNKTSPPVDPHPSDLGPLKSQVSPSAHPCHTHFPSTSSS